MSELRRVPIRTNQFRFWLWLINLIGVIVPRRLRADWRQEWEAELKYRENLLSDWDQLDLFHKFDLFRRSLGAFWDALWLQPARLEDEMFQDLRYGVRMALKNPGFTVVLVFTLALGIGANAALFSVVNGVLLNPLPYHNPDQLMTFHQSKPNFATGAIPYPNFLDLQKNNQTFSLMAISRGYGFSLIGVGDSERVFGRMVTADFFSVLELKPALGRTFSPDEDQPGAAPVAVISNNLWERKFSSSPEIIGTSITLDDRSYSVIGVLPANFKLFGNSDVFVPIGQWNNPALKSRSAALGLHGIGRLKPGVSVEQGEADLNRIMSELADIYPKTNRGNGSKVIPMKERLVGGIEPILLLLLGAVGFVLLIACVNVSNLLLARSTSRTREFAIRAALGAGQMRLLRQTLTESTLLSLTGGILGLAIAGWGTKAALNLLPTALPRAEEVGLDARVLVFTLAISLLTGIVSGVVPAFKSSSWRLSDTLKEGGRTAAPMRKRAQSVLVAVEVALALVLLIGAGLMVRSLSALWKVDPGFRTENLLTFGVAFPPAMRNATPEASFANLRDLSRQLNTLPGVRSASFTAGAAPLQGEDDLFFYIDGQPKPASTSEMQMALIYRVEPSYLAAMGIPLKQGRFFTDQDGEKNQSVVVIDEIFAQKYFANENPIGHRLNLGGDQDPHEIVGVVGHVMQWGLDSDDKQSLRAQLYQPLAQSGGQYSDASVALRTEASPLASMENIRELARRQHSENVIFGPQTMDEVIGESLAERRFAMILLGSFAGVSLLLATIGIYGVISYIVGQRIHEIGIRMALGASRGDIVRLVLGNGMKMAISGVVIGVIAAIGLTRLIREMLFGVQPTDPLTFTVIAALLLGVAILACYVPARRATRVDPLNALRQE